MISQRATVFGGGSIVRLFLIALLVLIAAAPARAEEEKFTRTVTVLDPITLDAEGLRITLWGLKAIGGGVSDLKAVDFMERRIGGSPVSCKVVGGASPNVVARCSFSSGEDIGLELLSRGLALVDKRQDTRSVPAYADAQKSARRNVEGIWQRVASEEQGMPVWLQVLLGASPVIGLLLVAFVMHHRLRRLENAQREEKEQASHKETQLQARERHVLASTLEGELTENKNRIEVFLTIYGEMLENLKSKQPKYQLSGDIVQKHPSLSKTVFEASVGKLSLLDMKLAAQLSKLYAALPKEHEYVNIEPGVPVDSAIALVEKVIHDAKALEPPIAAVIAALDEIIAASRKSEA